MSQIIPISYTNKIMTKPTRFIINDIILCSFSIIDTGNISLLFAIHQDLFDKFEYIDLNINLGSYKELENFKKSGFLVDDLKKDPECKKHLAELTQYLKQSNLYTVDFNFEWLDDKKFYIFKGIRSTGKDLSECQEYQINESMYIQIRLFKEYLINGGLTNDIFFDQALKTTTSITPLYVKLDGTIIEEFLVPVNATSKMKYYRISSHYTFTNGPISIKANYVYEFPKKPDHALREPMTVDQYNAQFGNDPKIITSLYNSEDDTLTSIIVDRDNNKTQLIRLSKEMYEKTNLKDMKNYIFYNEIETETPFVVPHIKFKF